MDRSTAGPNAVRTVRSSARQCRNAARALGTAAQYIPASRCGNSLFSASYAWAELADIGRAFHRAESDPTADRCGTAVRAVAARWPLRPRPARTPDTWHRKAERVER